MFGNLICFDPQYAECDGLVCNEILPLEFMTKIDVVNRCRRERYLCPKCMKEVNIPKEEKVKTT